MFWKLSKNSPVKNILLISLSNVGDAVLIAPVMDILFRDFPSAKFSIVVGERAASLFEGNSRIEHIHIFDKKRSFTQHIEWTLELKKYRYDVVIDMRNTMIGFLLMPRWITPPLVLLDRSFHLKRQHLNRLRSLYAFDEQPKVLSAIMPSPQDSEHVEQLIRPFLEGDESFVFIAPFAADSAKTWSPVGFAELSQLIVKKYGLKIIMIGAEQNKEGIEQIKSLSGMPILNLAGKTNLIQVAALIKKSKIAVVHDSGPMHLASYLDIPVIALFGPTDPRFSAPWGALGRVVHHNNLCARCRNPRLEKVLHDCMAGISTRDVWKVFQEIYEQI